ncbi:hypothetical protein N7532_006956, partial [Penicillium argentinense]
RWKNYIPNLGQISQKLRVNLMCLINGSVAAIGAKNNYLNVNLMVGSLILPKRKLYIDFLAAISSIRTKTFTLRTIHLGFKLSGIWPINPNIVCDNLVDYNHPEVPESPSTNSSNSTNISTPKTIQRFQRLESMLLTLNKDISHHENIVKKLSKGAQSCAYQLEEAHREIETSKAATAARNARYANVAKMKRDKQKLTDLEAIDKLRPQWKKVMIELKRHCRQSGRRSKR